jgi:hypothetical protein
MLVHNSDNRFPPAYVSRVRLDLFATPVLTNPPRRRRDDAA